MEDEADRACTEIETSDAQNWSVTNEQSQRYELRFDLRTTAQLGGMSEAGGNGGTASEASHESANVFTMLGNAPGPWFFRRILS